MNLLLALVSCGIGFLLGSLISWQVYSRLLGRLRQRAKALETIRDLESRRVAYDSGRDHLVRTRAGAPARVQDGMATKPGTLAKYLRDTGATKKNDGRNA